MRIRQNCATRAVLAQFWRTWHRLGGTTQNDERLGSPLRFMESQPTMSFTADFLFLRNKIRHFSFAHRCQRATVLPRDELSCHDETRSCHEGTWKSDRTAGLSRRSDLPRRVLAPKQSGGGSATETGAKADHFNLRKPLKRTQKDRRGHKRT